MSWLQTHFHEIKSAAEFLSFVGTILVAVFAWRALRQLEHGASQVRLATDQIRLARELAQTQAKREAYRIAAEQSVSFSEKIIPLMNKFTVLQRSGKYPILTASTVEERWPNIQSQTNNLSGLLEEVVSNEGLVMQICNGMEGFAMFFACGIADADKAYWPISSTFCKSVRRFLPFIVHANQQRKQYTYTLAVYSAWGMRDHKEQLEKEITDKKAHLSEIKVPALPTIGTG